MTRQKATIVSADQVETVIREDRGWGGYASPIATSSRVRRRAVLNGETTQEARQRWARKEALEDELNAEKRRDGSGRVSPVIYD